MSNMSNETISAQLDDAQRTLANLERQKAECVAMIERLRRSLPAGDARNRDVTAEVRYDTNDYKWLREWVHFGTGEMPSPWDELTWADVRTPELAEFPALFSDCAVTLSNGVRIKGNVTSINYHRSLAAIRTPCGENFAGPMHLGGFAHSFGRY